MTACQCRLAQEVRHGKVFVWHRRQLRRYFARIVVENSQRTGEKLELESCGDDEEKVRVCLCDGGVTTPERYQLDITFTNGKNHFT